MEYTVRAKGSNPLTITGFPFGCFGILLCEVVAGCGKSGLLVVNRLFAASFSYFSSLGFLLPHPGFAYFPSLHPKSCIGKVRRVRFLKVVIFPAGVCGGAVVIIHRRGGFEVNYRGGFGVVVGCFFVAFCFFSL